jgi:polyhydroxyalkanoate synthesis regulator phasin
VNVAMKWRQVVWRAVLGILLINPAAGFCQETKTDAEALLQLLRQKGVISEKEAREFLQRSSGLPAAPPETRAAETEALQEEVNRLREQLNRNA